MEPISATPGGGAGTATSLPNQEVVEEPIREVAPFQLDPIRTGFTPLDEKESQKIEDILRYKYNQFESVEDEQQRKEVLLKLNQLVVEWIREVGRSDGRSEDIIQNSGGKIFIFGSFKLGVHFTRNGYRLTLLSTKTHRQRKALFWHLGQKFGRSHLSY